MPLGITLIVSVILFILNPAWASADHFRTSAPQAFLVDGDSGAVLFAKNPDKAFSPANLTKLMTAEVIFDALQKGEISEQTEFRVSHHAWSKGGAPSRKTAMFAKAGTKISVINLLQGLIISSGNDSAIILAEGLSGSEEAFAQRMNKRAGELQMKHSHFVNATGLPAEGQVSTVRDMVLLARHIWLEHPRYFRLYAQPQFTWSRITQRNRNPLMTKASGFDGFAAGFAEHEGYSVVATVEKDGRRLFMAMGGFAKENLCIRESRRFINWSLSAFEMKLLYQAGDEVGKAKVYGGQAGSVSLKTTGPVGVLLPKHAKTQLRARILYQGPLVAPVAANTVIGNLTVYSGQEIVATQPVMTATGVQEGGLAKKAGDALFEISFGWLRKYL